MSVVLFPAAAFGISAHRPVFCPSINHVYSSNNCLRIHGPKYRIASKRESFYKRDIKYQSYWFSSSRNILFSISVNSGDAFLSSVGDDNAYSSESEVLGTDGDELLAARTSFLEAQAKQEAALKEKDELLLKLAQSDIRQQECVSAIMHDKEVAVSELDDAKSLFNQNLQKSVEEKFSLETKLILAKQDAIELAVQVEKLAENAFQKATSHILEDAQLRILAAETSASDASFKIEDQIRNVTEETIVPIVEQSKKAIEKALAVAERAGDTTMKAVATITDGTDQLDEIVSIQSQNLKLQNSVHSLESEVLFTKSEVERLKLELEKALAIANSSEIRANAAERHLIEFQESSRKTSLQHKEEIKSLLEKMKKDAADRMRSISKAFKVELEGIKAAIEASKRTEHFKDVAYVRRCEALQRSLMASEAASKTWRHRAEMAESLILKKSSLEGEENNIFVVNGGRVNLWSENDSQKWKFLSEGPRREIPEWMAQRIRTIRPKFEPRRNDISEASLSKFKPLDLPKSDNVWSIAEEKGDTLIKRVIEKDVLDKKRKDLERSLQRNPVQWQKTSDPTKLAPGTGAGKEIVFQGFNWESWRRKWYLELAPKAADLSKSGITAVWFPPPTESVAPQGYMPSDLYNLNSAYGSEEELKHCVEEMHNHDILALGDAVLNHRCAHKQSPNGVWNIFGGKLAWGPKAIVCDDPSFHGEGNPSSGDIFHAAPNIDHSQQFVRDDIKQWLNWLRNDIGFDGWRLDFVRGFSGSYVKEYIEASKPAFSIGEYWDSLSYEGGNLCYNQDAHRQRIVNWINATGGTSSAFDVTTKGILHSALHNQYWRLIDPQGKPTGVMGWWPSRAVTFLENHDTGSTQGHWPFPREKLSQGYAYILTHPGTPVIFYDHFYDFGIRDVITELIEARRRGGVHCRSSVKIYHANNEGYVAGVGDGLVMKMGDLDWNPSKEIRLEGSWHKFLNKSSQYQVWLRQ